MLCEACLTLFRGSLGLRASEDDDWSDVSTDSSSASIEEYPADRPIHSPTASQTYPTRESSTEVSPRCEDTDASSGQWENLSDASSVYEAEESDEESGSSLSLDSSSTSSQQCRKWSTKTREHHPSAGSLRVSMQQGCQICHSLWHKMTKEVEGADLSSFESPSFSTEVQFTRSRKQKKDIDIDLDANEYFRRDHFPDEATFSFKLRQVSSLSLSRVVL